MVIYSHQLALFYSIQTYVTTSELHLILEFKGQDERSIRQSYWYDASTAYSSHFLLWSQQKQICLGQYDLGAITDIVM
jgi:hypothetical protein